MNVGMKNLGNFNISLILMNPEQMIRTYFNMQETGEFGIR